MDNAKNTLDIYEIMRQLGLQQERFEEIRKASLLHKETKESVEQKIHKPIFIISDSPSIS